MKKDITLTDKSSIESFQTLNLENITELSIKAIDWETFNEMEMEMDMDMDPINCITLKIKECSDLNYLSLSGLDLGLNCDIPNVLEQLLSCTNLFNTLKTLDLSDNGLTCGDLDDDLFTTLIQSLSALNILRLHDNYLFSKDDHSHLYSPADSVNAFFRRLCTLNYPQTLSCFSIDTEQLQTAINHSELQKAAINFQNTMNAKNIDLYQSHESEESSGTLSQNSLSTVGFFRIDNTGNRDSISELSDEEFYWSFSSQN